MVLSPNSMSQQPPYNQQDVTHGGEAEDTTSALLGVGAYFGVFVLIIPARVVYDRTASSVGSAHLYRGFLASMRGGCSDLVNGYKRLWQEDGLRTFAKWPGLGFVIGVGAYAVQEGLQQLCHRLFNITEQDINDRSAKWHASKALCLGSSGLLLFPATIVWTLCSTQRMPSWSTYIRDKAFRGRGYFYSPAPLCSLSFLGFFLADVIRARALHWNKKTFFPDLLLSRAQPDDDVYEDEPETQPVLIGGAYRPLLFQVTNISIYTLCAMLSAVITGPIDLVTARMTAHPLLYGPLGILGTFRAIYREEGASGFFKGFVPNLLFLMGTYCAGIDEEAETGKPPL